MLSSPLRPASTLVFVAALLAGCGAAAVARWTEPLVRGAGLAANGDRQAALAAYAAAEARIGRFGLTRVVFADGYAAAVYNQLALLFEAGRYDAVIEKAADAPPGASPRFWTGTAMLALALAEKEPDAQLARAAGAEDALRQALQDAPADWDTKFNFETAARLAATLRDRPATTRKRPAPLLRPQPAAAGPARKVG